MSFFNEALFPGGMEGKCAEAFQQNRDNRDKNLFSVK
jgi:hypothetical protein